MKDYIHKGQVYENGFVDTSEIISDDSKIKVVSGDDGFHLADPVIGNFEWWYFDMIDIQNNVFLKIVIHLGTNPFKTYIFTQLVLSISAGGVSENLSRKYALADFKASTENCQIQLKDEFEVRVEYRLQTEYFISVSLPEFSAGLHFNNEIEGWKPSGDRVRFHQSGRSADFMWVIPSPKARVDGYFIYKGNRYNLQNAIGYHDHNYCSVNKKRPLHLDAMVLKWYWGKCYCEEYTIIFGDTFFRTNRLRSLFVAKGNEIIHSSNNLFDLNIENTGYDAILKTFYPSSLSACLKENAFLLKVFIDAVKIIDKKDLLEGTNPFLGWIIKKLVARPVYFGIIAQIIMEIDNKKIKGYGNYEYMAFRT